MILNLDKIIDFELLLKRTECVKGVYDDDAVFMEACQEITDKNFEVLDAFTPFPVHGLEKVLGLRESRLDVVAFVTGMTGTIIALTMMLYMMHFDWAVIIGGKPSMAIPSFIPITFELTVLLAALGMVGAYFVRAQLLPGYMPKIYHQRATNDRFVVLVNATDTDNEAIKKVLYETGALEIENDEYVEQVSPVPLPIPMEKKQTQEIKPYETEAV